MKTDNVVCFSGGHSSALVAIEVYRRYGKDGLVLLNHDIIDKSEHADIKRFKRDISEYLSTPITYANMKDWDKKDQFDVVIKEQAFKVGNNGDSFCTSRMKTRPFEKFLADNYPNGNAVIYYGFDATETARIQRRSSHLGLLGYKTDYPLAFWPRTIHATKEVGIQPPSSYRVFKHANCQGCLKAGKQHWYVIYCLRPDIWEKAKHAEEEIGYSIIKGSFLEELEPKFEAMRSAGVCPNETIPSSQFFADANRKINSTDNFALFEQEQVPCECMS